MSTKTLERVTLHKGRVFTLVREKVALENGVTIDLDIVRHPGAAAMVPLTKNNTLMMIRQYRHAVGGYIWEIPAGTLNPNETPLDCAKRELVEEIGYSADRWHKLGEITPVPGYSDERIHIFCAMDLTPAIQHLDRDEILDVHEVSFEEAVRMAELGEIGDAKTISGLFMARLWLNHEETGFGGVKNREPRRRTF
jgi:ADP-ribose pyrophosphatase